MCSKKKQGQVCGKGVFWARIYLAVHLVLVLIPIAIVANILGQVIQKRISQEKFLKLTYVLLLLVGLVLLITS